MSDKSEWILENVTVVVFAKDEIQRLPCVLENFKRAKNLLVVDNGSVDGTDALACSYGRKVITIIHHGWVENDEVFEEVWKNIQTEFILIAFCAEYFPESLLESLDGYSRSQNVDLVMLRRISITSGRRIPIDCPPKWLAFRYKGEIRFYKKGSIDYSKNRVHGRGEIKCGANRVRVLPLRARSSFYQFRDHDTAFTERQHGAYNETIASQRFEANESPSVFRGILKGIRVFLVRYFLYGGFRHGTPGLIHCFHRLYMEFSIEARHYEKIHQLGFSQMRAKNVAMRREWLETNRP